MQGCGVGGMSGPPCVLLVLVDISKLLYIVRAMIRRILQYSVRLLFLYTPHKLTKLIKYMKKILANHC